MTTAGPGDPVYLDEKQTRDELTRVFDACGSCRSCVELCVTFPTLFTMLDRLPEPGADQLTPDQQDHVIDTCSRCGLCAADCRGGSDAGAAPIDMPQAVARAHAMRRAAGLQPIRRRRTTRVLGRADRIGRVATTVPAVANRCVTAPPGSWTRRLLATLTGVSSSRRLLPYASQRWSSWMRRRGGIVGPPRDSVTVYPTCVVEYQDTAVGRGLVEALERAGIECTPSSARCCGAPWLQSGDIDRFARVARRNVRLLAADIRRHGDIVVAQPACTGVITRDYPRHAPGGDADFVAAHTRDAASHLVRLRETGRGEVGTPGDTSPESSLGRCTVVVTNGSAAADSEPVPSLMSLAGLDVTTVRQCSGTDGLWGLRAEHDGVVSELGGRLRRRLRTLAPVASDGPDLVVGDSVLARSLVAEDGGPVVVDPVVGSERRLGHGTPS